MAFKRMQYFQVYVAKEQGIYIVYTCSECSAGRAYSLRSNHWFAKLEGGAFKHRIFFLFTDIKMSTTLFLFPTGPILLFYNSLAVMLISTKCSPYHVDTHNNDHIVAIAFHVCFPNNTNRSECVCVFKFYYSNER